MPVRIIAPIGVGVRFAPDGPNILAIPGVERRTNRMRAGVFDVFQSLALACGLLLRWRSREAQSPRPRKLAFMLGQSLDERNRSAFGLREQMPRRRVVWRLTVCGRRK